MENNNLPENIDEIENAYKGLDNYEETPPPQVLENIQTKLYESNTSVKKLNSSMVWKIAAALLIVVGVAWWLFTSEPQQANQPIEMANPAPEKTVHDSSNLVPIPSK